MWCVRKILFVLLVDVARLGMGEEVASLVSPADIVCASMTLMVMKLF